MLATFASLASLVAETLAARLRSSYVHFTFSPAGLIRMSEAVFLVQPYVAKARGLVAQPARLYPDEASARRAGGHLARFRHGVVVLSQSFDPVTLRKDRPVTLAVHGRIPEGWGGSSRAA